MKLFAIALAGIASVASASLYVSGFDTNPAAPAITADAPAAAASALVADLPLTPVKVTTAPNSDTMAIYLTGDGGYARFDQKVVQGLAARGIPTVALDVGVYFAQMRTPETAASAIARTLRAYRMQWSAKRVVIVGYSFGADVAPFIVNRLPSDVRSAVMSVALMAPSNIAPWQVTLAERVGLDNPGGRPTAPELATLSASGTPILCLHGVQDSTACPTRAQGSFVDVPMPGGHGFKGDGDGIAAAIVARTLPFHAGATGSAQRQQ